MKFTPMNGQVLIAKRVSETEKLSTGGLVIPQNVVDPSAAVKADVIKTGNDTDKYTYQVKKDDVIFVRSWSGNQVVIDGIDCALINETEILGYWRE